MYHHQPSFGIIGAMAQEIEQLREALDQPQQHQFGQIVVYSGQLEGHCVAICLSGIGKVNAAVATTVLVQHFAVDYIVNTGSAGGLGRDMKIGDVVIGTQLAHHDVDVTAFGYEYGQVPQLPSRFESHTRLVAAAKRAMKSMQTPIHCGLIVSGDQFIHDGAVRERLMRFFPDVLAVEMEAAAIAQACRVLNKPFVVIRAVSDTADGGATMSFDEFLPIAARHSAQLVRGLIQTFVDAD